jgi:hypothetical protein
MMTEAVQTKLQSPGWVKEMQKHFQEKGYYRPEDLERAIGDQSTGVEVKVSTGIPANLILRK